MDHQCHLQENLNLLAGSAGTPMFIGIISPFHPIAENPRCEAFTDMGEHLVYHIFINNYK